MRLLFHLPILCLLLVGFTACARENNNGPDGPEDPPPGERPVAPVAPVASATIRGQVTLVGEAPTMRFVRIGEPTCVKYHQTTGQKPRAEQVVVGPRGELANCFVYVSKGVKKVPRPSQTPVDLDQKGCIYTPHVVGVQVGQPLHVKNNDPLMHNVNALAKQNRPFNQGQPKGSKPIVKTFRRPEIMMQVVCNVHGWMRAWVGVVPHPWFAVTNANGTFQLPEIPPGKYTLTVWHEKYGTQDSRVFEIGDGEVKKIDFRYRAESPPAH